MEIDERELLVTIWRGDESWVRIFHVPSGAVGFCGDYKSPVLNKRKAMKRLKAKLKEGEND